MMLSIRRMFLVALVAATCTSFVTGAGFLTISKVGGSAAVTEQFQHIGTDKFLFTLTGYKSLGLPSDECMDGDDDLFYGGKGNQLKCDEDTNDANWIHGAHRMKVVIGQVNDLLQVVANTETPNEHVHYFDGFDFRGSDPTQYKNSFEFEVFGQEDDIKRLQFYDGDYTVSWSFEGSPMSPTSAQGPGPPPDDPTLLVPDVSPFSGLAFKVSVQDNDKGLATVQRSEDNEYPTDIPEGRAQNYEVVLESIPIEGSTVIVRFTSNNNTLTVTPDFVEFQPENWNVVQKVAVGAFDDAIAYPSPHTASFGITQESELDNNFDDITLPDIFVTIEDNDFLANLGYSAITWSAETLSGQGSNIKLTVTMTISVVKSSIPATFQVGDDVNIDAVVAVGGEVNMVDPSMTIVAKDSLYTTLTLVVEHTFINSASAANAPRVLSISHCCRQRELLNNKDSSKKTMVLADLDFVGASPVVGVIPVVNLPTAANTRRARSYYGDNSAVSTSSRARRASGATTFQIPAYSNGNPLKYALGTTSEYGASLLGGPYGLEVDATTGVVTWDTTAVAEGLWNLVVIVTDLVTFGEITVELLLNVYVASADETPDLSCVKCTSTQYLEVGSEFESAFGAGTAVVEFVGGLPTGGVVAGNSFKWTPAADQIGSYIQCFQAVEAVSSHASAPQCVTMIVMDTVGNIPSLTIPATAQFAAGGDGPAVLASTATLTLAGVSQVSEITVELSKVKDAGFEELTVDPSAVSLALGISQPRSETLIVSGTADIDVFQSFLRNVRYTNSLDMPTVGDRTVLLKARTSDGLISLVKTLTLSVSIKNSAPVFHLDKNDTGLDYNTVFFRSGDPVLISGEALLTDADSDIASATVTLAAIPDGDDELLMSTYVAPPKLAGGGLYVSGRVDKKFGSEELGGDTVVSSFKVGDTPPENKAIVQDVNVIVDISHSYIGDLQIFLEHNGRVEELVSRPGGAACAVDDLYNTVFDQSSNVGLARSDKDAGACVGYTRGVYEPSGNLDNFNGMKADGDWTLRVVDLQTESDNGMVRQWGIALRTTLTHVSEVASITPRMTLSKSQLATTHSLYVGASGQVEDINVGLNLFSSHMANTKIEITSPKGTKVVLFDGSLKCAKSNFGVTVFDDEAKGTFAAPGCTPASLDELSTTFQPVEPLAAFVGERIIGTWVITVSAISVDDLNVEFLGWSIDMNSQPNIARNYDSSTGVLTLTGPDTADEFDTILSSIAYKNKKINPTEAARSIVTVVTDVPGAASAAAKTSMAIHHLDDLALININEDDYMYTGDTKMCGTVCSKDLSLQKFNDVGKIIEKAIPSDNSIILDGTSWTRSSVSDDLGIAVITADDENGEWQFSIDSGSNWTPMNDEDAQVKPEKALTLHGKPEGQNLIRFVPNLDFHETAVFDFVIWEMGAADVSGNKGVNTLDRDDISKASTTVTITVDPVNDSPIIAMRVGYDLIDAGLIDEDIGGGASNRGVSVSAILTQDFGTIYTDIDAATPTGLAAEHGIAVIHVENSHGIWQWMCDTVLGSVKQGIWNNFVGGLEGNSIVHLPEESKATLLGSRCAVRFEPDLNYNTALDLNGDEWTVRNPYIEFKGWDNTGATLGLQGTPGIDSRQDSYRDWHNPFSNSTLEAEVSVDNINDIPVLTIHAADVTEYAATYIEDGVKVALVDADAVLIEDVDHARMDKLTITLSQDVDMGPDTKTIGDVLTFKTDDTALKVTSSNTNGKLVYTIEPKDASDIDSKKREDYALVLKSAMYESVLEEPRAGERKFTFEVFDEFDGATGSYGTSVAVYSVITVVAVNDVPVLGLGTSVQAKYTEGTVGQIVVDTQGSIEDNDSQTMASMTVTLVARPDGSEEFLSVQGLGDVTVTYTDSTGVLFIDGVASIEDYVSMLQTVKYTNNKFDYEKGNPDTSARKITYVVNDGTDTSAEGSTSLSFEGVNDKPYVSFTVDPKVYVEEEGAVTVFTGTVLSDIDSDTLSYIDVEIVNPPDGAAETLKYTPYVATVQVGGQNTVATYEPTASTFENGKLRFSGLISTDLFSKILASITYLNSADEPKVGDRVIKVTANDGELDSDPVEQKISIELRNDAPSINAAATLEDFAIDEDDSGATNFTTKFMLSDASDAFIAIIEDDDNAAGSAPFGVAIVAVDGSNGVWEFMTAGATIWSPLSVSEETTPLTTFTNALLVTVDDDTLVRFVPDQDYHGSAALSFVAWDGSRSPQRVAGARSNAKYDGQATGAFSEAAATYTVTVDAVNDTPIINDITPITLISIIEDDNLQESSWNDVADIVKSIDATDVDGPDVLGVAIVSSETGGYGKWQYSDNAGKTFVDIIADFPGRSAVLLSGATPATTYIRFVPNPDVSGDATLTLAAWDETTFTASSVQDIREVNFVTDPISEQSIELELEITAVNDSPVLLKNTLPENMIEDTKTFTSKANGGLLSVAISTLFPTVLTQNKETVYKDVDDFSVLGVVVIGLDGTHGDWFWQCPSIDEFFHKFIGGETEGVIYKKDPTVNHGTVLGSACRVRFEPTKDFNTDFDLQGEAWTTDITPYIEFKAWDNTGDTEGTLVGTSGINTVVAGGVFNEFSDETSKFIVTVTSTNDMPVTTVHTGAGNYATSYTEDQAGSVLIASADAAIADPDNAKLKKVVVTLTNAVDDTDEVVEWDSSISAIQVDQVLSSGALTLTLTPSEGATEYAHQFTAALKSLAYKNTNVEAAAGVRVFEFYAVDAQNGEGPTVTTELNVLPFNDKPVLDLNGAGTVGLGFAVEYVEGVLSQAIVDKDNLIISDNDNANLMSLTVTLENAPDGEEEVLDALVVPIELEKVVVKGSSVTITGEASKATYEAIARSVTYSNNLYDYTRGNPTMTPRKVTFVVSDGDAVSDEVFTQITFAAVNDEPFVDLNGDVVGENVAVEFVEEEGEVRLFGDDIVLFDIDTTTLEYIEISITNVLDGDAELLSYKPYKEENVVGDQTNDITIDPTSSSFEGGVLRIAGLDSVENYRKILASVTYDNAQDEPTTADRVISVVAFDGELKSETRTATVAIILRNDAPTVVAGDVAVVQTTDEDATLTITVADLLALYPAGTFVDDDLPGQTAPSGIAVVGADDSNGVWQAKKLDGSVVSISGQAVNAGNAILLDASVASLEFVPDQDFHGAASLDFVAWDMTASNVGYTFTTTTYSATGQFSAGSIAFNVDVLPINDSPVVLASTSVTLKSIDEDDSTSGGLWNDVADIVAEIGATDVDGQHPAGIAVFEKDNTNGEWQFSVDSGASFKPFPDFGSGMALALSGSVAGVSLIRFVPALDFHEGATLKVMSWDESGAHLPGTVVNYGAADVVIGEFSSATDGAELSIVVNPINDAPIVTDGAMLTSIVEDDKAVNITGDSVEQLVYSDTVAHMFSDVDQATPSGENYKVGIAVVGVDRRFGDWKWQCNPETDFFSFVGGILADGTTFPEDPSASQATLLSADCLIKFVPNENFNTEFDSNGAIRDDSDKPYLTFIGWDRFETTYSYLDFFTEISFTRTMDASKWPGEFAIDTTQSREQTSSFSLEEATMSITVSSVNDPPVVQLGFGPRSVRGRGRRSHDKMDEDERRFEVPVPVILIEPSAGLSHDAAFIEDGEPVAITDNAVHCVDSNDFCGVTDTDNAWLTSLTITIGVEDPGYDMLTFDMDNTTVTVASTNSGSQCVDWHGTFMDLDGNGCDWYEANKDECGTDRRSRRNTASEDGSGSGDADIDDEFFNELDVLRSVGKQNGDDGSGSGSEDDGRGTPVVELVIAGISYQDLLDSADAQTAIVEIKTQIVDHVEKMSPGTQVEKVQLKAGNAQRNRRSEGGGIIAVIYLNKASDEDAAELVDQFKEMINDEDSTFVINLPSGKTLQFTGAVSNRVDSSKNIWTGEFAADVCCVCGGGHKDMNGRDVYTEIDGNFEFVVERELTALTMKYTIHHPAFAGALSDADIQLLAKNGKRGYNNEMPVSAYNTILESAKFYSRHSEPANATRSISVVANDGFAAVEEFTSIRIQLKASTHPVIDLRTSEYEYTEGSGPEVVIDDGLILDDEDHSEFFLMETLFIFDVTASPSLGDALSVDTSSSTITFDASAFSTTGVVVLEGPAPAAEFAAVLKTLSFNNTEEEPTIGARVYGVQAIDANNLESNVARLTIDVVPLNDQTPKFNLVGIQALKYKGTSEYAGDIDYTAVTADFSGAATIDFLEDTDEKKYFGNIRLVDDDSGDLDINVVTFTLLAMQDAASEKLTAISSTTSINVTWTTVGEVGTLTLQGPAKVDEFNEIISSVVYVNTAEEPGDVDRTVEIRADDGVNIGEADITIDVEVVNDIPVISYVSADSIGMFTEGDADGAVLFNTIAIADNDHTELSSARLVIENAADVDYEELKLDAVAAATAGITHQWDASTSTLTLSSTATLEQYQSIIASVKYTHSDENPGNPTAGSRTIKVKVSDDEDTSNELTVSIEVVPVNDAAIVNTNDFVGNFVEESDGAKVADAAMTVEDVDTPLLAYGVVYIINAEDRGHEALELRASGTPTVKSADLMTTCKIMCEYSEHAGDCASDCANGKYDASHVLVVEPKAGGAGIGAEDLQEAFKNVYYTNSMDEPVATTRQIGFLAFDSALYSNLVTSSVTITMVNDAPVFYVGNNTDKFVTTFTEGSGPIEVIDSANVDNIIVDDDHDHIVSLSARLLGKCAETDCGSNACDNNGWCLVDNSYEGIYSTSGDSDDTVPADRASWQRTEYDTLYEREHDARDHQDKIGKSMSTFELKTTNGQREIAVVEKLMRDMRYINLNHNITDGIERKITFVVADLESLASTAVSTVITLSSLNTEPITVAKSEDTDFSIDEDADAVEIALLTLFVDDTDFAEDRSPTDIQVSTQPAFGTVSVSGGTVSFTAAENDYGTRTFGVKVCDAELACSKELVFTFVIAPVNDPPYPINANLLYTILEDEASVIDFKDFFYDVEDAHLEPFNDKISISGYQENSITWPDESTKFSTWTDWKLRQRVSGSTSKYQLKPKLNKNSEYSGSNATVYFEACDSVNLCTDMSVSIYVKNVNDDPTIKVVFNGKSYIEATEDETVKVPLDVSDVEDDASSPYPKRVVSTEITGEPSSGTAEVNYDETEEQWFLTYTPDADYFGKDTLELTVTDSDNASDTKTATILVQAVRDSPRVMIDALSVVEDTPREFVVIGNIIVDPEIDAAGESFLTPAGIKLLADDDGDGTPETQVLSLVTEEGATVTYITQSNLLKYAPAEHFFGADSFTVQACSNKFMKTELTTTGFTQTETVGESACEEMTIQVAVSSSNDAPVLPDTFNVSVYEDNTLPISIASKITDVEQSGTNWIDIVFINNDEEVSASGATSDTSKGTVMYNNATGEIIYTPDANIFGLDTIKYKVCDTEALCTIGSIDVDVLPVNDPPEILASFKTYMANNPAGYTVEEDRFNLIYSQNGIYYDPDIADSRVENMQDLMDSKSPALEIEVITPPANGNIIPYSKNGYISYQAVKDFVGPDQVTIRVCDICSSVRNKEIRGDAEEMSIDAACIREREESAAIANTVKAGGGSGDGGDDDAAEDGCLTVTLILQVKNVNDNLVSLDLAEVINADEASALVKQVVFCPIDYAIETDDIQRDAILEIGGDLETYGLKLETDIDYDSLTVIGEANLGTIEVRNNAQGVCNTVGASSILYTATDGSIGADSFTYKVCDKQKTCTESTAHVYIAKGAPKIKSVFAVAGTSGAGTDEDPFVDSDSRYSTGDSYTITFNMDTNMPPTGKVGVDISGDDISKILNFSQAITAETIGFHGIWNSESSLSVIIDDVGVEEILIDSPNLEIAVVSKPECGPFDVDSSVYTLQEETKFCLKNSEGNSLPSESTNLGLFTERGWGATIGDVNEIFVKCAADVGTDYLGPGCVIGIVINPGMSLRLLEEFCGPNGELANECMDLSAFGDSVDVELKFTERDDNLINEAAARRASTTGPSTLIEIDFKQLLNAKVVPSDSDKFFDAVRNAWRGEDPYAKLADSIANHYGFPETAGALANYVTDANSPVAKQRAEITAAIALYIEGLEANTPLVSRVAYTGNGATLQKIRLIFDRETNTPSNILANNQVTQEGIDALFTFNLDMGTYQGTWVSRTTLEIDVIVVNPNLVGVPTVTFRSNQDSNGVDTETPCRGVNVCGPSTSLLSWGICDRGETSCRASGVVGAASQATDAVDSPNPVAVDFNPPDADASINGQSSTNPDGTPVTEANSMAGSSSYAFLGLLVLIPLIAGIIYYSSVKRTERAENKRAMKAFLQKKMTWNGDGADGKPVNLDTSEMWNRPPGMVAMRSNPDPFLNLSGGTGAAPTAAPKVTDPFAPRAPASMKLPGGLAPGGLQAPQRGLGSVGGKPQVGLSSLPPLKQGGPGAGPGGARGTGLPPPKLPPMGGRKSGASIPRQSQGGARRPGPGNNRVSPGGPAGNRSSTGNRTAFQNIAGRASKGDLFNIARRTSNSSFNGEKTEDPFSRAGSGGGANRSNSMPRRPNFKGMAQGTMNAGRMARPNVPPPRGMPGQGPMSPPGGMRGRGGGAGPGGGRGRGMPMAPGRGGGRGGGRGMPMSPPGAGGRGGGRGMPMSPPGAGGRGRPSMAGGRGMPMSAGRGGGRGGGPGRGRGGGLAAPRASMGPPSAGGNRNGGAGFKSPSPAPSPRPVMKGMPGSKPQQPGGAPRAPGASADPFSRPAGPPAGPPGGPPRPGPPGASADPFSRPAGPPGGPPGGPPRPGGPARPGAPGAGTSDPFSRPGGINSGAIKPPQ